MEVAIKLAISDWLKLALDFSADDNLVIVSVSFELVPEYGEGV